MYERELRVAIEATRKAMTLCQKVQSSVTSDTLAKKDKSPVTVADFGSQAIIARALLEHFPGIPLIAEEDSAALRSEENQSLLARVVSEVSDHFDDKSIAAEEVCGWIDHGGADSYSDAFWTLDPIDGTKGFLRGEQYAVALALVVDGKPVCATLGCPNLPHPSGGKGSLFCATSTQSECRDAKGEAATVIRVSTEANLADCRFCESVESAHSDHSESQRIARSLQISAAPVRMDSQAKYGTLARGDAEIYLRLPTRADYVERIWDHAAGALVLQSAGGRVTDISGNELDFRHGRGLEKNKGIVASHGLHHDEILRSILAQS